MNTKLAFGLLAELGPLELTHGEFDREQEVLLLPDGETCLKDGSKVLVDRQAFESIEAARKKHGVQIPFDINHSTILKGTKGERADAFGWIDRFAYETRRGLLAHVTWTDAGYELIKDGTYKYVSPAFRYERATGRVHDVHSAALTTKPATPGMPELLAAMEGLFVEETTDMDGKLMKLLQEGGEGVATAEQLLGRITKILAAKGVDAGNSAESVLSAVIKVLKGEGEGEAPSEGGDEADVAATVRDKLGLEKGADKTSVLKALADLQAHIGYTDNEQVKALTERIGELEANERKRRGAELREKYKTKINPRNEKMMAWAIQTSEEDPEHFERMVKDAPPAIPEQGKTEGPPAKDQRATVIATAREEYASGQGSNITGSVEYVNGALKEEGFAALTEAEKESLVTV